jgi:hypothetical protein
LFTRLYRIATIIANILEGTCPPAPSPQKIPENR